MVEHSVDQICSGLHRADLILAHIFPLDNGLQQVAVMTMILNDETRFAGWHPMLDAVVEMHRLHGRCNVLTSKKSNNCTQKLDTTKDISTALTHKRSTLGKPESFVQLAGPQDKGA